MQDRWINWLFIRYSQVADSATVADAPLEGQVGTNRPRVIDLPSQDGLSMPGGDGCEETFRFGLFEVDLRSRELRKNGRKVPLQGQPFQVFAILLRESGKVVTRE